MGAAKCRDCAGFTPDTVGTGGLGSCPDPDKTLRLMPGWEGYENYWAPAYQAKLPFPGSAACNQFKENPDQPGT
jgi:hypothetical protein